jgi:hypothetical protein
MVGAAVLLFGQSVSGSEQDAAPMAVELLPDHSVLVSAGPEAKAVFNPRFGVFVSDKDPKPRLRWMEFGEQRQEGIAYNVIAWPIDEVVQKPTPEVNATQHVEDGYDPTTDQVMTEEFTADIFQAAPMRVIEAKSAEKRSDGTIVWKFAEQEDFTFSAELKPSQGEGEPVLHFEITPKKNAYYSVAYLGAPAEKADAVSEIWQPLIWQEMRFPDQAYLTESARCTIPATTVTKDGVTVAVDLCSHAESDIDLWRGGAQRRWRGAANPGGADSRRCRIAAQGG